MVKSNNNPNFQILKKSQVIELVEKLSFFYDSDLNFLKNYIFYINTREKVFISKVDINSLEVERINAIGLYFGTFHNDRFRLSIEGSNLISPKRNFVEIDEKVLKSYLAAENLFKDEVLNICHEDNCPFLIVRYDNESLGCVSMNIKDNILMNYVPKSRKLDFNKVF